MPNDIPKIAPIKLQEYEVQQSKYSMVPQLPMRSMILGPSGSRQKCSLVQFNFKHISRMFSTYLCLVPFN
jgi:hypothetical protein